MNGTVFSGDLFGREDNYRYYFPLLRDAAFRMAGREDVAKPADRQEAYFKAVDAVDTFQAAKRHSDEHYSGSGQIKRVETDQMAEFELTFNNMRIHEAFFTR